MAGQWIRDHPIAKGLKCSCGAAATGEGHSKCWRDSCTVKSIFILKERANESGTWLKTALFITLITLSHGFIDSFTNGGHGVGFFIPFENHRHFMPHDYRVLQVSPIGRRFFSSAGWKVIYSEFIWVWLPTIITCLFSLKLKKSINELKT